MESKDDAIEDEFKNLMDTLTPYIYQGEEIPDDRIVYFPYSEDGRCKVKFTFHTKKGDALQFELYKTREAAEQVFKYLARKYGLEGTFEIHECSYEQYRKFFIDK